jgi:SAM-dependent methyltransferase
MSVTKLYGSLAPWFHLLTAPEDYEEEATFYLNTLRKACASPINTVLELGSGGGNNALHMKKHVTMTLTDLSPEMLELSRQINPELEHIVGDMRTVRLGREFDAVFIHDAIMYMATEADLRAAIETAYVHTCPGGAAVFCPDYTTETYEPSTSCGGHDEPNSLRGLRYLEWTWDSDQADARYNVEFALLLRDEDGSVRIEQDHHTFGLFPRDDWFRIIAGVGFTPGAVKMKHSELIAPIEVFVGKKEVR